MRHPRGVSRIEVTPQALPAIAQGIRAFATDLAYALGRRPVTDAAELQAALDAVHRSWRREQADIVEAAGQCAASTMAAAETYEQLERLLIPGALR